MKTFSIAAPEGHHWMEYEGGPVLMIGEYKPHEGASAEFDFEVIEEHDPERLAKGEEWDRIYRAILERTGNKELAAATATARAGSRFDKQKDDPKTPAKPSERRRGSARNPRGSAGGQRGGIKLSEANIKGLERKRDEHNEKVGDAKTKRVNLGQLKAVFRRGAGAFSTSHRPSVTSRDQWAMARVNAFLHLMRTGKPKNAAYVTDNDLLPDGHPRAGKVEKKITFVVSMPSQLDVVRKRHLCGPDGITFQNDYLAPLGLTRDDIEVCDLGELSESDQEPDEAFPDLIISLGKAAKIALGDLVDISLPHPCGVKKSGGSRDMLKRKLGQINQALEKQDSYQPPKGVQEAAARGLRLRREHGRGGTEVGVARARDLSNGRRVSIDTVRRMSSFFSRHAVDLKAPKNRNPKAPGYPGAGLIAHLLWGGDPGKSWADRIMQRESKKTIEIAKADDSKRIVYGVVLDPSIIDAHGDYLAPAVIEETAHDFLASSRVVGVEHNGKAEGAKVVESWLHPYPSKEDYELAIRGEPHNSRRTQFGDDHITSGSWVMAVKLPEEQWEKVKSGGLNAFSIGGFGSREPMDADDMPEITYVNF